VACLNIIHYFIGNFKIFRKKNRFRLTNRSVAASLVNKILSRRRSREKTEKKDAKYIANTLFGMIK
jgi:hypothetical protein